MSYQQFVKTKNTYYSGLSGAMGGLLGGKAWHSALISGAIASVDVACFPLERPATISPGKWFLGNLLSSTATGLVAYTLGHGARSMFKQQEMPDTSFANQELVRREAKNALSNSPHSLS